MGWNAAALGWSIDLDEVGPSAMPDKIEPVEAPFAMPELLRPRFAERIVRLGGTPRRDAIQPAIDRLAAQGGGRLVVGQGEWLTGRIVLRSGIDLHLEAGAVVRFSGSIADYLPPVFTRCEGIEVMGLGGLIYAHQQQRIAITGRGELVGPDEGPVREARPGLSDKIVDPEAAVADRVFDGVAGRHYFRPYFICPVECREVLIEGVTLRNGPMWNIVPVYCDRVVVRGVTIDSRGVVNGDGVNIDSSRNVLVEYCSTNTGDDCYAIKAGRNEDGLRVGRPAENIVIRKCLATGGFGGVTFGSETAGGVRNVRVHDCIFEDVRHAAYFKTRRPRGGGGENLFVERIRFRSSSHGVFFDMIGSPMYVGELGNRLPRRQVTPATPRYDGITVSRVQGEAGGEAFKIKGIPESPARNVRLQGVEIRSENLINLADVDGVVVTHCLFTSANPTIRLVDASAVRFERTRFRTSAGGSAQVAVRIASGPGAQFEKCEPHPAAVPPVNP